MTKECLDQSIQAKLYRLLNYQYLASRFRRSKEYVMYHANLRQRDEERNQIVADHMLLNERIANLREAVEGLLDTECKYYDLNIKFAKGVLGVERSCERSE